MLEDVFTRISVIRKLESGPFGPYLSDIAATLKKQNYARYSIQQYIRAADALGKWLVENNIEVSSVDEGVIENYLTNIARRKIRSRPDGVLQHIAIGLRKLLQLLRTLNIVSVQKQIASPTPIDQILLEYDQYMNNTLGLKESTRKRYLYFSRLFLINTFISETPHWEKLEANDIVNFILEEVGRHKRNGRKTAVSSLRVFLRYLVIRNFLRPGLDAAIPRIRTWKHASLPDHFSPEEITKLLNACDDASAISNRNQTILMLLSRLGVRAMEVARLQLDDIDWNQGTIIIRFSKSRRERLLPLPSDVGESLINYLRNGRPKTSSRYIFLRHEAPYQPLQWPAAITSIVKRTMIKAGVKHRSLGAHLFRHTAASQMVNSGASFKDVADVLGHQSLSTTAIYAKLDLNTLSQVALPWPGGVQ